MKTNKFTLAIYSILSVAVLTLYACGGGSSSTPMVSGVASSGAPMSGTAFLKDSANNPEMNTPINAQTGRFSFNVSGKTAPYMLRAGTLYSMSNGPGTANINPLSHLMVANAAGFTNMSSMNAFYNNPNGTEMNTISGNMGTALTTMQKTMQQLLTSYDVATVNPITGPITIGQGMDRMFDNVKMAIDASGNVSMMNVNGTAAGQTAYTGAMGSMSNWHMGTVTPPSTTPPVSGISISPSLVKMQVNATQTQQFTATGLTAPVLWSVAPATGGGSITTTGLYTGPNVQGMFLVIATGTDGKTATATVQMGSGGMMM
ncbi:MAG: hypothetical protein HIU83_16430 [Proteobacteria bacterium]|nr:hypothetical protein [Pseudomonadota bacterium]